MWAGIVPIATVKQALRHNNDQVVYLLDPTFEKSSEAANK